MNFPKNKSYLDYACGKWNNHIKLLQNEDYDIIGYDPYVNIQNEDVIINKKYDFVISNNFLEHVIDPYEDIKKLLDFLNEKGSLIFISPCLEFVFDFTHYHTFFFQGKSLEYLSKKLKLIPVMKEKIFFPFDKNEFTYLIHFRKES